MNFVGRLSPELRNLFTSGNKKKEYNNIIFGAQKYFF